MAITSQQKGKLAEFLVFGELLRGGADLYLPIIDIGIDAIVRREDGTHLDIQVKSTEKGWSLAAWVPDNLQQLQRRFIVWVDMSKPEIWVFPGEIFKDYSIKIGEIQDFTHRRLDLDAVRKGDNQPRRALLKKYLNAWELIIKGNTTQGVV